MSSVSEVGMDRQIVTEEELLDWLNTELRKREECDDCRFTSVMRLRDTDPDGCNWSSPNLRCSGRPVEPCNVVANEIAAQAHGLVNLKED